MSKSKLYYFIDIDLNTKTVVGWGESDSATHSGDMDEDLVHRMFLSVGQYNKLLKKLGHV